MSEFEVKTYPVTIEKHPDADRLELACIGDYYSIVLKGQFQTGDICAYIPEASVVPASLIAKMGLEGKLAGPAHNRVKAIKLRGILSQGLVYPMPDHPQGMDVADILGITKWEPPIPTNMSGQVEHRLGHTLKFPVENIKKYPEMFQEGEDVIITEKIHGTWCCMGRAGGEPLVSSLGMSKLGLGLKMNVFMTHREDIPEYRVVRARFVPEDALPVSTLILCSGLADPVFRIEVEVVATIP